MTSYKKDKSHEIGKTYGNLTVWSCDYRMYTSTSGRKSGSHTAFTVCICGGFRNVLLDHLRNGGVVSCGCKSTEKLTEAMIKKRKHNIEDYIGKRYGRLLVLGEGPSRRKREFACVCECGQLCLAPITSLVGGIKKSCGCARENIANSHRHDLDDFIKDSTSVHGSIYDYSNTNYISNHEKVEIGCKVVGHGTFMQTPANHKNGAGCPKCRKAGFNNTLEGTLYVLESEGITKIGITNSPTASRVSTIKSNSKRNFTIYNEYKFNSGEECADIERVVLSILRRRYLNPVTQFDGYTECFCDVDARTVDSVVKQVFKEYYDN